VHVVPPVRLTLLSDVLSLKAATGIPRRQGIPFALRTTVATAEMVAASVQCNAKGKPSTRFAMLRLIHPPGETQARIASHFLRYRRFAMHFDYKGFHIDCRARHDEDGHYVAQAKLTRGATANTPAEVHQSGDIDSFVDESDAMICARTWAIEWIDENWD
jgi:hypothetical protein